GIYRYGNGRAIIGIGSLAVGDFNGDRVPDVAIGNSVAGFALFRPGQSNFLYGTVLLNQTPEWAYMLGRLKADLQDLVANGHLSSKFYKPIAKNIDKIEGRLAGPTKRPIMEKLGALCHQIDAKAKAVKHPVSPKKAFFTDDEAAV